MVRREKLFRGLNRGFMQIVFAGYSVVVIFPMVWLLYTSFKSGRELFASAWALPKVLRWIMRIPYRCTM